jgi:hypothetical protein
MNATGAIDASLLRLVRDRTGAPETAICRAYESDASFRAACADVRICLRALRRWEAADSRRAPALAVEYAELLEDLAEELRRILKSEP